MTFGERLAYARKQKKIRQADLGKIVGTSGDIIGKYERGENMPSIEVAAKIADALEVTLDYLVKDGVYETIDSTTLKRLKDIEKLPADLKEKVFFFIDMSISYHKTKEAFS
jgi:transcriptional regulator with XRE-family HTH domain